MRHWIRLLDDPTEKHHHDLLCPRSAKTRPTRQNLSSIHPSHITTVPRSSRIAFSAARSHYMETDEMISHVSGRIRGGRNSGKRRRGLDQTSEMVW